MDYQRQNVQTIQRLMQRRQAQANKLRRLIKDFKPGTLRLDLLNVLAKVKQQHVELAYWYRVKSGQIP